jgi:putative hemolysin
MIYTYEIALFLFLMLVSAFSAMAEASLLSISKYKVKSWVEKKKIGSHYVKKLKDSPETLLSTTLILNNLANTGVAAIMTEAALRLFDNNAVAIATGVATFLILIFGDIIPKSMATTHNEFFAPVAAPIVWQISKLIYPLTVMLNIILKVINKLLGKAQSQSITRDELRYLIKAGQEEGSIKDIERRMIQRVFEFENTTVSDVMTRKKLMALVDCEMKIKDVLQMPNIKLFSRFPVYQKNKENIIGILYLKDMLLFAKDGKADTQVKDLMRKPFFVFESKKVDSMLRLFQARKEHMAIVINNKAQVVGLVTIENILEEIVGEIIDESDRINPNLVQIAKNEWLAKGILEIEELNRKTGMQVKESDYDSMDSFVVGTLGRAPKVGDETTYQSYKILIEEVQGKKVLSARILKVN